MENWLPDAAKFCEISFHSVWYCMYDMQFKQTNVR